MTATAIVMMIVAMLVVWGGLAVSIRYLVRNPLSGDLDTSPGDQPSTSERR
ncbi:methionine/alanine import family NSS transporter small subunit [Georgenia deserti]|uniref:Methionine/alanine import family NSS transporter small subunit n=1 Tax=Georgenia deserti TaxID=2093781 RepID=A0ABW4L963_9MICO